MDVYPSRRKIWTSILGLAAFFLGFAVWAATAIDHGPKRSDWIILVGLGFSGWAFIAAVRELRRPVPMAHLDEEGFECALGRVAWANVSGISVRWHWVWAGRGSFPSRRVFFDLKNAGEAPGPVTQEYLLRSVFGGPVETDGQITMPLWDSSARVLADVQRFHPTS